MAEARPSKVGATWASKTIGSIRTGLRPAWCRASAKVAPGMPAPAMMTSMSFGMSFGTSPAAMRLALRRLVLAEAHDVEARVHVHHLAGGREAEVRQQPERRAGDALHGGVLLHGAERAALGQHA